MRFIVIDLDTGKTISQHRSESDAQDAAMMLRRRGVDVLVTTYVC